MRRCVSHLRGTRVRAGRGQEVLRQLAPARAIEPTAKLSYLHVLEETAIQWCSTAALQRLNAILGCAKTAENAVVGLLG